MCRRCSGTSIGRSRALFTTFGSPGSASSANFKSRTPALPTSRSTQRVVIPLVAGNWIAWEARIASPSYTLSCASAGPLWRMLTCALTVEPARPIGGTCTSSSSRSSAMVSAPTPTVCTGTPKLAISAIRAASKSSELSAPSVTSTMAATAPDCAPRSTPSSASPIRVTGPGAGTCSIDGSSTRSPAKPNRFTSNDDWSCGSASVDRLSIACCKRDSSRSPYSMLADVSSKTATEFSCGRSVCVTSAGRHASTSSTLNNAACSTPSALARAMPSPWRRRARLIATATDAATINVINNPIGQPLANASSARSNVAREYLNNSSNNGGSVSLAPLSRPTARSVLPNTVPDDPTGIATTRATRCRGPQRYPGRRGLGLGSGQNSRYAQSAESPAPRQNRGRSVRSLPKAERLRLDPKANSLCRDEGPGYHRCSLDPSRSVFAPAGSRRTRLRHSESTPLVRRKSWLALAIALLGLAATAEDLGDAPDQPTNEFHFTRMFYSDGG